MPSVGVPAAHLLESALQLRSTLLHHSHAGLRLHTRLALRLNDGYNGGSLLQQRQPARGERSRASGDRCSGGAATARPGKPAAAAWQQPEELVRHALRRCHPHQKLRRRTCIPLALAGGFVSQPAIAPGCTHAPWRAPPPPAAQSPPRPPLSSARTLPRPPPTRREPAPAQSAESMVKTRGTEGLVGVR